MSLYEILRLLIEVVKIVINIITHLFRRWRKKKGNKK